MVLQEFNTGFENLAHKKILVTGATGFIGSHMVAHLVNLNAQVTAMGPSVGWRPTTARLIQEKHVRFVPYRTVWSRAASEQARSALKDIDYVIHLAYSKPTGLNSLEAAAADIRKNVLGTILLFRLLPDSVTKICFASSTAVYGPTPPLPVTESCYVHPISMYAAGKIAVENYLQAYVGEKKASLAILRYATVYGPMETVPRAIPNFIRAVMAGEAPVIHGNGGDVCDYVHVQDVVKATLLALTHETGCSQVINIGSGIGHTTQDIAMKIIDLTGRLIQPIYIASQHVPKRIVCDITRAGSVLGYRPTVPLEIGLLEEIHFFADHPALWKNP